MTQLAQAVISLLTPIYEAQFASIRASRVKAMDETPIKAGRSGHGKMQTGYFWPIYGEHDEVCFPFHSARSPDFVCHALGIKPVVNAVLLTDGYAACEQYAEKTGINHARCWSHGRRGFFEALTAEPSGAAEATCASPYAISVSGKLFPDRKPDDEIIACCPSRCLRRRHRSTQHNAN